MAKSTKITTESKVEETAVDTANEAKVSSSSTVSPELSAILAMMNELKSTVGDLKAQLDEERAKNTELKNKLEETAPVIEKVVEVPVAQVSETSSATDRLLDILANKRSDKEVIIVHNREMIGGLSTSLRLTGLDIDFHTLGEQRVLSWQQFEECVSKYRKWFNKEIILLGPGQDDIAERYNVPMVNRGKAMLTKSDLNTLASKSERQLEDFMNTLSENDQEFVCSYWLGQCYQKNEAFMKRSKIELLNRINGKGAFDTLLTGMNFDSVKH